MRKSHLVFLITLFILSLGTTAFAADAAQGSAPAGVVNINTAEAEQLALLPGVGAKAAQRIVDYRTQNGKFAKTTDLMQVKGFGDKSYERLAQYLTVEGKTTLTTKVRMPRKAKKQPSNTAS